MSASMGLVMGDEAVVVFMVMEGVLLTSAGLGKYLFEKIKIQETKIKNQETRYKKQNKLDVENENRGTMNRIADE